MAAILLEGESGSSGCIKFPPGYWQRIKAIADKYGILTIDDEVMSGFGRTGKMFAIENHGVEPDILCMAKGLTAGYLPLGGIIVKQAHGVSLRADAMWTTNWLAAVLIPVDL